MIETGADDTAEELIREINASSVNKVDDIRALLRDTMLVEPIFAKYKVIILDECHRLTPDAQNALLHDLENPPPWLVVMFATTDPDKLLDTVKSRCSPQIEVKRQSLKDMKVLLTEIARKEKLTIDKRSMELIAKRGGRIPRECINLLEEVANAYGRDVTCVNIDKYTGEVNADVYMEFIRASRGGLSEIVKFVSDFAKLDIDCGKFLSGLARFALDSVYIRMGINAEDFGADYLKRIKMLFGGSRIADFEHLLVTVEKSARRVTGDPNRDELLLTTLALELGDSDIGEEVKVNSVQEANIAALRKFAESENAPRKYEPAIQESTNDDLDALMSDFGAVEI